MKSMDSVQGELHKWGNANQVGFDATKESKHVLSLKDPLGPEFKLLGVTFDCKLEMESAVRSLTGKVKWKLLMLLRSRRSFHTTDLVIQYKQQVLSFIEYRTPAIYHATRTVLGRLDKQQDRFLRELGITREAALLDFNLAPLSTRRDIALLGLLHRAAIGEGPPHFREFFKRRAGSLKLVDPLAGRKMSPLYDDRSWGSSACIARSAILRHATLSRTFSGYYKLVLVPSSSKICTRTGRRCTPQDELERQRGAGVG